MIIQQQEEQDKRSKLQREKPLVYEKILKFEEKFKRGESIAIIQHQFDYFCNFNCIHCSIQGRMSNLRRELTVPDVKYIANQADALGLARWVFTGGEPLASPNLRPFVQAIGPERFYISCDSNGWNLDEKKAKWLKLIGVDRIQLSIDGLDAKTHDEFRRKPGSHLRCMKAIDATLEAGLGLFIQTCVTHSRLHSEEFEKFLRVFTEMDIGVFVTYAKPVGNFEGQFDEMVTKKDMNYFKQLEKKYKTFTHITPAYGINQGCIAVKGMITLTPYGDILGCQYMPISIGNTFKQSLKDIIKTGMKIKWFGSHINTCPIAEDKNFVNKYIAKTYGKRFPVNWDEIFTKEDMI